MSGEMVWVSIIALFVFGTLWEIYILLGSVESLRSHIDDIHFEMKLYLENIERYAESNRSDIKSLRSDMKDYFERITETIVTNIEYHEQNVIDIKHMKQLLDEYPEWKKEIEEDWPDNPWTK